MKSKHDFFLSKYELIPDDGHKSFGGKAIVYVDRKGNRTLFSYGTPVMRMEPNGMLHRLWNGWSLTTGRHVKTFCGIKKCEWDKMEVEL